MKYAHVAKISVLALGLISGCMGHSGAKESSVRIVERTSPYQEDLERAQNLFRIGEASAALHLLERIVREAPLDPASVEAASFAATIYESSGNTHGALEILQQLEREVQDPHAKARLANLIREKQGPAGAPQAIIEPEHERAPSPKVIEPLMPSSNTNTPVFGAVLPLTGTYAVYGQRALVALMLGLEIEPQIPNTSTSTFMGDGFKLIVMDSKADAATAEQQTQILTQDPDTVAVFGDIVSQTASTVAQTASAKGVVDVSLARQSGIPGLGKSVFRLGLTSSKQAQFLAQKAVIDKSIKRFAILYPENAYGREMKDAFVREVQKLSGEVVKTVSYPANETTYTKYARALAPRPLASSSSYASCAQSANKISNSEARQRALTKCADVVAPKPQFEALFIADFPKNTSYIVPALVSEGLLVSQDPRIQRSYQRMMQLPDAQPIQLLGPSSWHDPIIAQRLGAQVNGAIFVDVIDFLNPSPTLLDFVQKFSSTIGSNPTLLDAESFDAGALGLSALRKLGYQDSVSKERFLDEIAQTHLSGLTGQIAFDAQGEAVAEPMWFTFEDGTIVPL